VNRAEGRRLLFSCLALPLLACGPWDLASLEARHPALERVGAAPLAELTPYFIAMEGELTAFVCRWPTGSRLGVEVVGDAHVDDLAVLDRALAAWGGAGLGIALERGALPVAIEVHFADASEGRSGVAAVDCRVREAGVERVEASLAFASITLRRAALDWRGHRVALAEEERLGAALHELGHALGFQGHPRRGETVMLRSVDHVRWAGAGVARGEPFRDSALAALYALPSGAVLGRVVLPAGRTRELDAARREASAAGRPDLWIRVGDRAARFHWGIASTVFLVPDVNEIFLNPEAFRATRSPEF
jgi:hypothetical protein